MRGTRSVGQQRALEPDSMPNMPIALVIYAISAIKLRANVVALFFFQFRNECERIGRYRPKADFRIADADAAAGQQSLASDQSRRAARQPTIGNPQLSLVSCLLECCKICMSQDSDVKREDGGWLKKRSTS